VEYSKNNSSDIMNHVHIFSNDDENLKLLGELLSNESSRKILLMLVNQEMTANDIANKLNIRLSLVIHHLKKMQDADIVKISKIGKNSKNRDLKYYLAKQGILILPKKPSLVAKQSKSLSNSLNRILRYCSIGIISVLSGFVTRLQESSNKFSDSNYPVPMIVEDTTLPIIISLSVVIIGVIIELVFFKKKK